ncbi:rho guanine nucleotide exchange factor, partial [Coemansia erecta]
CPGFSQEFISINTTKRFSWYPKDNIEAFDKAMLDYISGQANLDEFQSVFRCTGLDDLGGFNTDHGKAVIRYHRSIICADLIFSEDNIGECYRMPVNDNRRRDTGDNSDDNDNSNDNDDGRGDNDAEIQLAQVLAASSASVVRSEPMPLCRSTCDAWIDSLHSIVTNSTLCRNNPGISREASLDSLRGKCKAAAYNGAPGHCVQGDENEPETCGYQRVEDWCKYCRDAVNYYDTCASVGVQVGRSNMDGSNGNGNGNGGSSRLPAIPGINDKPPYNRILSRLRKEQRQERMFRIVAIVLSVIVGLCLIIMIILLTLGNKKPLPGMFPAKRGMHSTSSSADSKDDSTLLHLGGEGQNNQEKEGDFVDYFINVVGKPRQVIRHFFARRDDEISLHQGDI